MSITGKYLWDPHAWLADDKVGRMTYEVQGMYRRLLDHQWEHGSIPADPVEIGIILNSGVNLVNAETLGPLLACLLAPFKASPEGPHRLRQKRMHEVREEWLAKQDFFRQKGQEGAAKRWGARPDGQAISPPTEKRRGANANIRKDNVRKDKEREGGEGEYEGAAAPVAAAPPSKNSNPKPQKSATAKIRKNFTGDAQGAVKALREKRDPITSRDQIVKAKPKEKGSGGPQTVERSQRLELMEHLVPGFREAWESWRAVSTGANTVWADLLKLRQFDELQTRYQSAEILAMLEMCTYGTQGKPWHGFKEQWYLNAQAGNNGNGRAGRGNRASNRAKNLDKHGNPLGEHQIAMGMGATPIEEGSGLVQTDERKFG